LREKLAGNPMAGAIHLVESVTSTNDAVRDYQDATETGSVVVVATEQTAGRGRLGRQWHSPAGLGLYVSTLFRPRCTALEALRWTLAAAVAGCEACRDASGFPVSIKWPNDLMVGTRKLGGLLAELRSGVTTEMVLGLGLNVFHERVDFPPELRSIATTLKLVTGKPGIDLDPLVVVYLTGLAKQTRLLEQGDWDSVSRAWEAMTPTAHGHPVRILGRDQSLQNAREGVTRGVDATGAIRVECGSGEIVSVQMVDSLILLET
jgi:BirA family biotin operon repressor/biotin-[acetyl-CoA-carboxylase] ligase